MAKEVEKVVAGFTQLSDTDRTKAIELLNEYISADIEQRRMLKETHKVQAGLDLGPTNQGGCPCCGK